jgi:hypothetical protein
VSRKSGKNKTKKHDELSLIYVYQKKMSVNNVLHLLIYLGESDLFHAMNHIPVTYALHLVCHKVPHSDQCCLGFCIQGVIESCTDILTTSH